MWICVIKLAKSTMLITWVFGERVVTTHCQYVSGAYDPHTAKQIRSKIMTRRRKGSFTIYASAHWAIVINSEKEMLSEALDIVQVGRRECCGTYHIYIKSGTRGDTAKQWADQIPGQGICLFASIGSADSKTFQRIELLLADWKTSRFGIQAAPDVQTDKLTVPLQAFMPVSSMQSTWCADTGETLILSLSFST
jgi:hypothetical protein